MRVAGLFAVATLTVPMATAQAESWGLADLYGRTQMLAQSLFGRGQDSGREVIAPPGNIDPKMAFEPPGHSGTMRVIRPTEPFQQRH